jgi:hypothetical protein
MMGMGLGCYNPMGNYPLTSLLITLGDQHHQDGSMVIGAW